MDKYDLIVIGGGPAGYAAAMRGIDFGKRVCLIEKERVGGVAGGVGVCATTGELLEPPPPPPPQEIRVNKTNTRVLFCFIIV